MLIDLTFFQQFPADRHFLVAYTNSATRWTFLYKRFSDTVDERFVMTTTPPFCLWVDESVLRSFFIFISPALFIIPVIIMNEGISVLLFPREEKKKKKTKRILRVLLERENEIYCTTRC